MQEDKKLFEITQYGQEIDHENFGKMVDWVLVEKWRPDLTPDYVSIVYNGERIDLPFNMMVALNKATSQEKIKTILEIVETQFTYRADIVSLRSGETCILESTHEFTNYREAFFSSHKMKAEYDAKELPVISIKKTAPNGGLVRDYILNKDGEGHDWFSLTPDKKILVTIGGKTIEVQIVDLDRTGYMVMAEADVAWVQFTANNIHQIL